MNLLVTGAWQGFAECEHILSDMGQECVFLQCEKDSLPVDYEWVEGVIGNGIFLSHPIEKFVNLKYVQLTSAGYDRIPMEYVIKHNIEIYNAKGVYSIPMAEYAIGSVLQLYKEFPVFSKEQQKHEWKKLRSLREINQKNICIVGCGSIGTECAKRFKAFGAVVNGVDPYVNENPFFDSIRPLSALDDTLASADVIILSVPLSDETKNLLNQHRMEGLKPQTVIVNMARGGVMDYEAFVRLKKSGSTLQAVLDVFEEEPLKKDSSIWDLEGVIVTPHNSFVGEFNQNRLNQVILTNLKNRRINV